MDISKYNDITLKKTEYGSIADIRADNTEIKYDWFDYSASGGKATDIYVIESHNITVGYAAFYDYDHTNKIVSVYGKVSEKQYFGDLLKALLSMMD